MLFIFRAMRVFQVLLALIALATGIGAVVAVASAAGDGGLILLAPAVFLGVVFFWSFGAALRAPTSFVAVAEERTRIRFAGLVDTVVANDDIISVRLVQWPLWGGLGVRTNFRGHVALTSMWGEAVELELRRPVRVSIIPGLWKVGANRLTLTIRNPQKLADRFGTASASSPSRATPRKMKRRGSRTR